MLDINPAALNILSTDLGFGLVTKDMSVFRGSYLEHFTNDYRLTRSFKFE